MSELKYRETFFLRNSDFSYKDEFKPQSILEVLEEVAGRHAEELGMGYHSCMSKNLAWVVVRTRVEIIQNLENGENGIIETYPSHPGKIDFDRSYAIYNMKNEPCIKAVSKWILMDYVNRRIQRSNVIEFPEGAADTTIIEVPSKIKLDEEKDLKNRIEVSAKLNDLDHNGHVNNARYAEYVFNTFDKEEKRVLKAFSCEYIKELKYGENAYIMYDDENENYALYNSENQLSFVMRIEWSK